MASQPLSYVHKSQRSASIADIQLIRNKQDQNGADDPHKNNKPLKKLPKVKPAANRTVMKNVMNKDQQMLQNKQNKTIVKQGEQRDKEMEERNKDEQQCDLCQRHRPVFVAETDDMIRRLPERFLSPLLKSLKKDFNNKRQYLKFLRISVKYIKACSCEDKSTH